MSWPYITDHISREEEIQAKSHFTYLQNETVVYFGADFCLSDRPDRNWPND